MKIRCLMLVLFVLSAAACQSSVCPPDSVTYLSETDIQLAQPASTGLAAPTPAQVSIAGKMAAVDQIVSGSLCNGTWSGTVYVGCNIQVAEWTDEKGPLFLEKCSLTIEPGTVVYVAAHNDAAYYNGCSCHTVSEPEAYPPDPDE